MNITDFDREWVESIAGCPVSDEEAAEFLRDFNSWMDHTVMMYQERD